MDTSTQKKGEAASPPANRSRFLDTQNVISFVMSLVDRIADAQTRQRFFNAVFKFSYQRPVLASFIALQSLFALFPVACFVGFTISTTLFCATTAIGFTLLCCGIAGVLLFWTLLIAFTLAASTWLWLAFCYFSIRYIGTITGFISKPSTALVPVKPSISKPTSSSSSTTKTNRPGCPKRKSSLADAIPVPEHPITNPLDPNGVSDELAAYPEHKQEGADLNGNGKGPNHWEKMNTEEMANPLDPNALPEAGSGRSSTIGEGDHGEEHGDMWEKIKHEGEVTGVPLRTVHVDRVKKGVEGRNGGSGQIVY